MVIQKTTLEHLLHRQIPGYAVWVYRLKSPLLYRTERMAPAIATVESIFEKLTAKRPQHRGCHGLAGSPPLSKTLSSAASRLPFADSALELVDARPVARQNRLIWLTSGSTSGYVRPASEFIALDQVLHFLGEVSVLESVA